MAGIKACSRCGKHKPLAEFNLNCAARDERQSQCKLCNVLSNDEWQKANRERKAENNRRWRERNPEKAKQHPAKERARTALRLALQSGEIEKPAECPRCGKQTASLDVHGHHPDYEQYLEVEWLCRWCHAALHKRRKDEAHSTSHSIDPGLT